MSLTRKEWEELWEIVKWMEARILFVHPKTRAKVARIKQLIQQVIGQME